MVEDGEGGEQGNEDEEILCHTHFLREEIFFLFDSHPPWAPTEPIPPLLLLLLPTAHFLREVYVFNSRTSFKMKTIK